MPHRALPFLGTLCTVISIFDHESPLLSGGLCFAERVTFAVESFVLFNTLHKPVKPISTYVLCAVSSILALVGLAMGSNCLIVSVAVFFHICSLTLVVNTVSVGPSRGVLSLTAGIEKMVCSDRNLL